MTLIIIIIMYPLVQAVLSGNTEVPARNLHQHIQNLMQVNIYIYICNNIYNIYDYL